MANRRRLQTALTGNHVTVEIGDVKVGIIRSVNGNDDMGMQVVSGIGRVNPYEHAAGMTRFSITVDTIYLFPGLIEGTEDLASADGLKNFEQADIAPKIAADVLNGNVFDFVVRTKGGAELYRYTDCSYNGGSTGIQAHQIVGRNANFMAIDKVFKGATPSVVFTGASN
jgi:hypothetical protein